MCTYTYTYISIYIYIYIHTYYTYIYIYIYRPGSRSVAGPTGATESGGDTVGSEETLVRAT